MQNHPHLLVDCKLIEDYQMSGPIDGHAHIASTTFQGKPAQFSIGSGGDVYFTYRSADSKSGWAQEKLSVKATLISAAHDPARGTVLLALDPQQFVEEGYTRHTLHILYRKDAHDAWHREQMPLGGQIHRIRLKNLKGKLYILFIFRRDREDDSYPYSMQFGPFAYKDTSLRENATPLDSLNADFGLDASGRPGLYMAFTPQIYWRPASGYDREFYDKGNQGTLDNQNITVWKPKVPQGAFATGYYAQKEHRDNPDFSHGAVPLHLAYPLEDPSKSNLFPPILKEVTQWNQVYDTHNTSTKDHQDFSFLRPVTGNGALKDHVAMGCIGLKDMDPNLGKGYGVYAVHKDHAAAAQFFRLTPSKPNVVVVADTEEAYNDLGIWYTGKCEPNKSKGKKCVSVSRIVPQDPRQGLEIGTFHARKGCDELTPEDGTAWCPTMDSDRLPSVILFSLAEGVPAWTAVSTKSDAKIISLAVSEPKLGPSDIVCTDANGQALRLSGMQAYGVGAWNPIPANTELRFAEVHALSNANDDLEVFAITRSGNPFHTLYTRKVIQSQFVAIEDVNALLPMLGPQETIAALDPCTDDAGNVAAFAVRDDGPALKPQFWVNESRTGNWTMHPIHTDEKAILQEIRSFSVQITALDPHEVPMPGVKLDIWAEGPAMLRINGRSHFVNRAGKVAQASLQDGRCRIMLPTDSIHAPILHIHADFMAADEYVSISPNADLQIKLAQVEQNGGLAAAQKNALHGKSEPLFPPDANGKQRDDLDDIGKFMSEAMRMVPHADYEADLKYLRWNREQPARPKQSGSKPKTLARIAPSGAQHFGFRLSQGKASYLAYTPAMAATQQQALMKTSGNWFTGAWGDAWNFIKQAGTAIAHGFEIVVTTLGNAVNATVAFVIKGVKYLYNGAVSLVQEVFAMVEGVFSAIGVAFEELVQWLGYIFDWQDIVRTKSAIASLVSFSFELQVQSIDILKGQLSQSLQEASSQLDQYTDQFLASLRADGKASSLLTGPGKSSEADAVNAHNIVLNSLADNGDAVAPPAPESMGDVFDNLIQGISSSFEERVSLDQFKEILQALFSPDLSATERLDSILASAATFLRNLAQFVLEVSDALLTAVLDAIKIGLQALRDRLEKPWGDGFIVSLYRRVTGEAQMSTLDLFTLMVAVPVSPVYKLMSGAAAFPDQSSLDQFQAHLKAIVDPNAPAPQLDTRQQQQLAIRAEGLFSVMRSSSQAIIIPVDAVLAILPPTPGVPATWQVPLSYMSTIVKVVDQVARMPLTFFLPGADTATWRVAMQSGFFLRWTSVMALRLLDATKATAIGVTFGNSGTVGTIYWTVVGGVMFVVNLSNLPQPTKDNPTAPSLTYASNLLSSFPDVFTFLKLPSIVASSEGTSLAAFATVNAFFKALGLGFAVWSDVETFKRLKD